MTIPTEIDFAAPVVSRHRRRVAAPVDRLWNLHTAPNEWPTWQRDIAFAQSDGAFEVGSSIRWGTTDGFTVTSTIYQLEPGRRVLWGGAAEGITGIHEWLFEPDGEGTVVLTNESWSFDTMPAEPDEVRLMLAASLEAWLGYLQQVAEK